MSSVNKNLLSAVVLRQFLPRKNLSISESNNLLGFVIVSDFVSDSELAKRQVDIDSINKFFQSFSYLESIFWC